MKIKVNIKEELNKRDLKTNNKYDLLSLYMVEERSSALKEKIAEALAKGISNKALAEMLSNESRYRSINESLQNKGSVLFEQNPTEDEDWYHLEDAYVDDDVSDLADTFIEDGKEWAIVNIVASREGPDVDGWNDIWNVVEAQDIDSGEISYFVMTEDGFVDWGPLDTAEEAENWLEHKWDNVAENLRNSYRRNRKIEEDTIKVKGGWVNKGKAGTHGKFRTKKEADAQRRAMFAKGFKENIEKKSSSVSSEYTGKSFKSKWNV